MQINITKLSTSKISILFFLLIIISFLTACFDASEIDDEVYPLFLGFDKGDDNSLILTVQYPVYTENGAGMSLESDEKDDEQGIDEGGVALGDTNIHSIETANILQGIDMLGMIISRRISLKHVKAIVFSEEISRDGIKEYLSTLIRFRETRQNMQIIVSKSKAKEFILGYRTGIGDSLSKSIELMITQSDNTGYFAQKEFKDFYFNIISPYSSAFAGYGSTENRDNKDYDQSESGDDNQVFNDDLTKEKESILKPEVKFEPGELPLKLGQERQFAGTAIFKGDKMLGTLNPDETKYFKMICGRFTRGFITFKDPNDNQKAIIIDSRLGRPVDVSTSLNGNKALININLEIEGDLNSIQSRINYEDVKLIDSLRKKMQKNIEQNAMAVIKKLQKQYNSDIFGFGEKLARNFQTIQDFEKFDWGNNFKHAKINLDVNVHLRRTGLIINSSPIKNN